MKRVFVLVHATARRLAAQYLQEAPDGAVVTFSEPTRTSEQNAKFHALCADLARSRVEWAGKRRNAAQWKVLLVSGHAKATGLEFDMVPGLEGEFVNLRESTALMSVKRSSSLIEYTVAWCAMHGVGVSEHVDADTGEITQGAA